MSGGGKAIELQLQMRQNAEDLHSFMRELETWETDIKQKDEHLRTEGAPEGERKLPPVRNKDYRAKMKEKRRKKEPTGQGDPEESKQAPRIKAYDYRSWDKFDVDKALEEVDKQESSNESDSEEQASDPEKALAEKEKGNRLFKEGKYDQAIECYSRGMGADPYNPVLPTNRAAAFCRLRKFAVAESDCNLAIALDSSYCKAYARRASARLALGRPEAALEDYQTLLKLDPGNAEAQSEVEKIQEVLGLQAAAPPSGATQAGGQGGAPQGGGQGGAPQGGGQEGDLEAQRLVEEQQRKQEAVEFKDRGNAFFKEGKFEEAVESYSRGIEADGLNVLLPANRAMALLKLQRFQEAEQDCSRAILLDGSYCKAFARRGTARAALGRLEEARQDFQQLLRLEPGNKQALTELQRLRPQRRTVQPVHKPENLRSEKPLRRMEIQEIQEIGGEPGGGAPGPSGPLIQEVWREAERDPSSPSPKMISVEAGPPLRPQEDAPPPPRTHRPAPPPANSFQLEADLRKMGAQPEAVYRYLRQIQPDAYGQIFHSSLEPHILNQILKTLHAFYREREAPASILQTLSSLAGVRRFDMAVMFLSAPERTVLRELFHFLLSAGLEPPAVEALRKKYGV
ncbi:LOW QUALITY PROTEIN: RNA polymerase II-associated protein 3 [Menidia menidia]